MSENKIKIFISYSHEDEKWIENFEKYFNPLVKTYDIELWRDTKNKAGSEFMGNINEKLNNSDIILLFLSANSLCSKPCQNEMKQALELKTQLGVIVIPIILSTCEWQETEVKNLLAIPKDGKPVSDFDDEHKAWQNVCQAIKEHIEYVQKFNSIELKDDFKHFLQEADGLTKAHSNKQELKLSDVFVAPELDCYDELREKENDTISFSKLEKDIFKYKKIVIVGGDQSGKTVLCKKLFIALKNKKKKLPIYLDNIIQGNIDKKIKEQFNQQYQSDKLSLTEVKDKIIPILDNFHKTLNKQKVIKDIDKTYEKFSILVIDDIFGLNIENSSLLKKFKHFKIKQLKPSLINKLIQKWMNLTDDKQCNDNERYKKIDEKTELVNTTLGKVIGNGIVPSYPFFILAILSTYETANPLDENITSQGHCYQALIYILLRKEVENNDIDIYLNFLTEIAYFFFKENKKEVLPEELKDFIREYQGKYNFPINKEHLLEKLNKAKILIKDSLGNIHFNYDYLYFYFVAKFLAEHIDCETSRKNIEDMVNNLHKNEYAYITIFVSHHLNKEYFLDEIVLNAMCLFDKYKPASLTKNDVYFLDRNIDYIVDASLPKSNETAEEERQKKLAQEDQKVEELQEKDSDDEEDEENHLGIEIRRTIKTVEVMGRIIKNRSGSLEKKRLEQIFEEAITTNLRFLGSFLFLIREDKIQSYLIEFIGERLKKTIQESNERPVNSELKNMATQIFWDINFSIIYGIINKTIYSLGSDNLKKITNKVCDDLNTPSSFLIKHGILMQYSKNLQIDDIVKKIKDKKFSKTAQSLIRFMVANYCATHNVGYADKDKLISSKLGFTKQNFRSKKSPHAL